MPEVHAWLVERSPMVINLMKLITVAPDSKQVEGLAVHTATMGDPGLTGNSRHD